MSFRLLQALGFIFYCNLIVAHKSYETSIFNFKNFHVKCANANNCYTLDTLVNTALEYGIDSKEKMQSLFQAKTKSRVQFGNILPQISIRGIAYTAFETMPNLDLAVGLVGFLFPSRWFEWKALRRLSRAEEKSLYTLLANTAQSVQHIYYDVQSQIWTIRILKFYIHELEDLINFLENKKNSGAHNVTDSDLALLKNFWSNIYYDYALANSLSAILPQLAISMGLDPSFNWDSLNVEEMAVKSIASCPKLNFEQFWPSALERSTEIKNIEYLIEAARKSKRAIYFDFFDPDSGNDLGLGLKYRVKIARSNITVLNIASKRTRMQLSNAIRRALYNYNSSLEAFIGVQAGFTDIGDLKKEIECNVNDENKPLDIFKILTYFDFSRRQTIRLATSYFGFLKALGDLNRYTWTGHTYDLVQVFLAKKLPTLMNDVKKSYSARHISKKKIKKLKKIKE